LFLKMAGSNGIRCNSHRRHNLLFRKFLALYLLRLIKIHVMYLPRIFCVSVLICLLGCRHTNKNETQSYKAGFRIIRTVDTSRSYKPGTSIDDNLHYRPLDIDVWYPATSSSTDTALLFRDLLGLLEQRANYYTASDAGNGLSRQIAKSLCEGMKCSDTTSLLNYKTQSVKNGLPVQGKFPLVVYLCAYNGMSFENFQLFEELAKRGFMVVSISSIGRYPGDMSMKREDLVQQVDDATAALHSLEKDPYVDLSKTAVIGYSWGGLAGSILASKIPGVACVVSLDGSEFHHYGNAKEENADFNGIRYNGEFANMRLSMPYLRLESSPLSAPDKEDSVYDFSEKLAGQHQLFKIDSAQHENFSCLPAIVNESGNCKGHRYYSLIPQLTIGFLQKYLKGEDAFDVLVKEEENKTIRRK
jgi:pimeloyl-ACP methyl ester carboxylesterase